MMTVRRSVMFPLIQRMSCPWMHLMNPLLLRLWRSHQMPTCHQKAQQHNATRRPNNATTLFNNATTPFNAHKLQAIIPSFSGQTCKETAATQLDVQPPDSPLDEHSFAQVTHFMMTQLSVKAGMRRWG